MAQKLALIKVQWEKKTYGRVQRRKPRETILRLTFYFLTFLTFNIKSIGLLSMIRCMFLHMIVEKASNLC